jgi:hypothetical protein
MMSTQSQEPEPTAVRLSEGEVRERLRLCEDPEIVDELYDFGQDLLKEVNDRIRALESKAVSFAAYGAAIVTLLVSSSSTWSRLGNRGSAWISICAGVCGLMCTSFSIRVLSLREFEWTSEDEWLKTECLTKINTLKRYRILTMWGVIHSHGKNHEEKARDIQRAQIWLTGSVIFLLYLLVQVTLLVNLGDKGWISWWKAIKSPLSISRWQNLLSCPGTLEGLAWAFVLGLTLILIYRRTRSV